MAKKKPVKKKAVAKKKSPAKKSAAKPKKASAKSKSQPPAEGTVVWMGLNTPDQASAARFYREVLRLQSKMVRMGEQSMMILSAGKNDVAHVSEMVEDRGPRWMAFFM